LKNPGEKKKKREKGQGVCKGKNYDVSYPGGGRSLLSIPSKKREGKNREDPEKGRKKEEI